MIALDTFLVALYTCIDDLYQAHFADRRVHRPGRRPQLSDSEVLTLMLLAQWLGRSERKLGRYAAQHWRAYFPRLLDHSSFNRRARALRGVLVALVPTVAATVGAATAPYQVIDGVPVPLARRDRGLRRRLFDDEAGLGCGGTDRDWYYGCELVLAVTDTGVITGFVLGSASTDERWLLDALLGWRKDAQAPLLDPEVLPPSHRKDGQRVGRTGPVGPPEGAGAVFDGTYIADSGLYGRAWQDHWQQDYGAVVLTARDLSPHRDHPSRRQFAAWRQVIERVNQELDAVFHLKLPGAKTLDGLLTRLAAKLVALNVGILLNRHFGRPALAFATLFSC